MIRVILDGNIIQESPPELNDLRAKAAVDRNVKGRFTTEDATLTFTGDGYALIKAKADQGFCGEISIRIEEDDNNQVWDVIHDGIIHVPACEFGIEPYYVKCPVDDNSFFARINKNKNLKALLTSDRTKNDQAITPAAYDIVEFFTPSTGSYDFADRYVFPGYEAFRFLVEWMSDGEVGFASSIFDTGGDYEGWGIILGAELRAGTVNSHDKQPEISFNDTFNELNKQGNLMIGIEIPSAGRPILRIENESYFYSSTSVVTLNNVHHIKRKVIAEKLFASVKAGSDKIDDSSGAVEYPETTRWLSFREEQYPTLGQCNLDTELDLVNTWIISSNVIEQIVVNNVTDYDKDIVIVEYNRSTLEANQSNWLVAGPPYFYNENLKNDKKVARHLSGIPNSIANFLGTANDERFLAHFNSDQIIQPVVAIASSAPMGFWGKNDFSGAGFDSNNNYGNGTTQGNLVLEGNARYTVPTGGFYSFESNVFGIVSQNNTAFAMIIRATITRYNSSDVVVESFSKDFQMPSSQSTMNAPFNFFITKSFLINASDYVTTKWEVINGDPFSGINSPGGYVVKYTIDKDSYFKCSFTNVGLSGVWATVDQLDFLAYAYTFRADLSRKQWDAIRANLSGAIYFNTDGITNYKGWIEQVSYNRGEGVADFTLLSSLRLTP